MAPELDCCEVQYVLEVDEKREEMSNVKTNVREVMRGAEQFVGFLRTYTEKKEEERRRRHD
jgi:hypothetical protein